MKLKQERCPICKGSGLLDCPTLRNKEMKAKKDIAKILRKEGFSMREIMRLMNYKSPQSVTKLLG